MSFDVERDYYSILGISSSATQEEIKHAYHSLARRYHPDSRPVPTPTTLFHQIQTAYAVLSDPESRRAYDQQRDERGLSPDGALAWEVVPSQHQLYTEHETQMLYLLVEIRAAAPSQKQRWPLNLSLVVDRSTSMKGRRLAQVKQAAHRIIDQLEPEDSLAVVTFNDRADVVVPNQKQINPIQAKAKISSIRAEGGTEILQGLRAGLAEVAKRHTSRVNSQVILLTDGQTYGDEDDCLSEAERAGDRQISITAMGIGEDWNDTLMEELAVHSGGTSAYIASADQIPSLLQERVSGMNAAFARGLSLAIRRSEDVRVKAVYRTAPDFDPLDTPDGVVDLGALREDAPMHVLLEVEVAAKSPGEHRLLQLDLTGEVLTEERGQQRRRERLRRDVHTTFTDDAPGSDGKVPPGILKALQQITLYRMQEQAWHALEAGDAAQATHKLHLVATRLLDLGEQQLAQAARLEAGRIGQGARPSDKGRKRIKYGTRMLTLDPGVEVDG